MKYIYYLVFILLFTNSINAQEINNYTPSTDVIVPSIENYFFTKYGDIRVENNQGSFSYNVPINTIKSGNINLNLSASYYTSGLKVNDIAGIIGMNWNLNAGGMITRVVRGLPDEISIHNSSYKTLRPLKSIMKEALENEYSEAEYQTKYLSIIKDLYSANGLSNSLSYIDTQQDIFTYNFNSYSGSFYIDNDQLYISDINIKGSYTFINHNGKLVLQFKFITPDGNTYVFGGSQDFVESSKITTNCGKTIGVEPDTTWYLSEIKDFNNNSMLFSYENDSKSYPLDFYKTYSITYDPNQGPYSKVLSRSNSDCISLFNSYNSKKLIKISYKEGTVNLKYINREDYTIGKKLTSLNVSNVNEDILTVKFNYTYSNSNFSGANAYKKRLFLESLMINNQKYVFEYNNINELPERLSNFQDLYGYANSNYETLTNFQLGSNLNRGKFIELFGDLRGNRSVDSKSLYGVLTKIIYPTNGYSLINYSNNIVEEYVIKEIKESNFINVEYQNCSSQYNNELAEKSFEFISNGESIEFDSKMDNIRCENVHVDDFHDIYDIQITNITTNETVSSYNGRYDKPLRTSTDGSSSITPIKTIAGHKYKFKISTNSKFNNTRAYVTVLYNKKSVSTPEMKNYSGAKVISIKNYNGDTFENEKKYYYNSLESILSQSSSLYSDHIYSYWSCSHTTQSKEVTFYFEPFSCQTTNFNTNSLSDIFNITTERINYKIITEETEEGFVEKNYNILNIDDDSQGILTNPIQYRNKSNNNWNNNILLSLNIYDKYKNLIKNIKYDHEMKNYIRFDNYNVEPGHLPVRIDPLLYTQSKYINTSEGCISLYCNIKTKVAVNHYYNYIFNHYLKSQKVTEYLNGGTVTTETTYNYDSPNHLQLTRQTVENSKGENITTEYIYPQDIPTYPNMDKLTAQNRISEPVIIKQKVGDFYISEVHNQYADFNGIIQKSAVHQRKGSGININNDTDLKIRYNNYDDKGNLTQYTLENGIPVSIIWGYNGQYPILKVEGVKLGDIPQDLIDYIKHPSDWGANNAELSVRLNYQRNEPYFKDAMVTGYVYKPLVGVTEIIQPNGQVEFYEYDSANLLKSIKNTHGEIIKTFEYNYANTESEINEVINYHNEEISYTVYKQCGSNQTTEPITYTIPAGRYSSTISVSDANNIARNSEQQAGQDYANSIGVCKNIYYNQEISYTVYKQCIGNAKSSPVRYTIPAGKYSSTISVENANSIAKDLEASDAQRYAEYHGFCLEKDQGLSYNSYL